MLAGGFLYAERRRGLMHIVFAAHCLCVVFEGIHNAACAALRILVPPAASELCGWRKPARAVSPETLNLGPPKASSCKNQHCHFAPNDLASLSRSLSSFLCALNRHAAGRHSTGEAFPMALFPCLSLRCLNRAGISPKRSAFCGVRGRQK